MHCYQQWACVQHMIKIGPVDMWFQTNVKKNVFAIALSSCLITDCPEITWKLHCLRQWTSYAPFEEIRFKRNECVLNRLSRFYTDIQIDREQLKLNKSKSLKNTLKEMMYSFLILFDLMKYVPCKTKCIYFPQNFFPHVLQR